MFCGLAKDALWTHFKVNERLAAPWQGKERIVCTCLVCHGPQGHDAPGLADGLFVRASVVVRVPRYIAQDQRPASRIFSKLVSPLTTCFRPSSDLTPMQPSNGPVWSPKKCPGFIPGGALGPVCRIVLIVDRRLLGIQTSSSGL